MSGINNNNNNNVNDNNNNVNDNNHLSKPHCSLYERLNLKRAINVLTIFNCVPIQKDLYPMLSSYADLE